MRGLLIQPAHAQDFPPGAVLPGSCRMMTPIPAGDSPVPASAGSPFVAAGTETRSDLCGQPSKPATARLRAKCFHSAGGIEKQSRPGRQQQDALSDETTVVL